MALLPRARAHRIDPPQKMTMPISMTRLRPNSSPTMPKASIAPANVSAYAPTTHCSDETPACRSPWMLPRATLTMVLSRKVKNRTTHSTARAMGRPPCRTDAASPSEISTGLTTLASRRARCRHGLQTLQTEQPAEAAHADLPCPVLVDGRPDLVRQRGRAADENVVLNGRVTRRNVADRDDLRRGQRRQALMGLRRNDGLELRAVLKQADPLGDWRLGIEEGHPVGCDRRIRDPARRASGAARGGGGRRGRRRRRGA